MNWKKGAITIATALSMFGVGVLINKSFNKSEPAQQPVEVAHKAPVKKVEDISIPEAPKVELKEVPKETPKEPPKVEPPKYEPKPVVYQAKAVFENPLTYAIAMGQWKVEVDYRKETNEPVQEDAMTRAYRFVKIAGTDNVVQRSELKTSDLEAKVEELRKKDGKPYKELSMGNLTISDKTEYTASVSVTPADKAQEDRMNKLSGYKTPEQAAYIAGMMNLHAKDGKITNEKLDYIENKVQEKYGDKK